MIDIVSVHDIGTFRFDDAPDFPGRFEGIDDLRGVTQLGECAVLVPVFDLFREVRRKLGWLIARMLH
jgi:hypothetical protein